MGQLPTSGPNIRVPVTFLPGNIPVLPSSAGIIGLGIADAAQSIGGAMENIRARKNKRRLAELEVADIDFLSGLHSDSMKMSLDRDSDEVSTFYSDTAQQRLDELLEIEDADLRDAAVSRFRISAARTGAVLQSSLVKREAERMETAHLAFFAQTMRGVEAGTIDPQDAAASMEERFEDGVGTYLTPEEAKLRTANALSEFEKAASDSATAEMIDLSADLTASYAAATNDEERSGIRSHYDAALSREVKLNTITQTNKARAMVTFDAVAKAKIDGEITAMREQVSDAVQLSDPVLLGRITKRADELPDSSRLDTLKLELRRGKAAIQMSRDRGLELAKAYPGPLPKDASKAHTDRNEAYRLLRGQGVPLAGLTTFFAQDSTLPSQLVDDVRALFDPVGGTFSIQEGINVLSSIEDADAARRLVAEDSMMKTALAAGVHGGVQMRVDAERLLTSGTARKILGEIDRFIAPKNKDDKKKQIDLREILEDADGESGDARLGTGYTDLFAGLLRLEYLKGRVEMGETAQEAKDNSEQRASSEFLKLRSAVSFGQKDVSYYDHRMVGANTQQFEAALQEFRFPGQGLMKIMMGTPDTILTELMTPISDTEVAVPAVGESGFTKIMIFDKTETDFERSFKVAEIGQEGFSQLATFIKESNRGTSFDPFGHLKRQPGDPASPGDSIVRQYLRAARGMLSGMNIPEDQRQQQTEVLADQLARDRGWAGLWGNETE